MAIILRLRHETASDVVPVIAVEGDGNRGTPRFPSSAASAKSRPDGAVFRRQAVDVMIAARGDRVGRNRRNDDAKVSFAYRGSAASVIGAVRLPIIAMTVGSAAATLTLADASPGSLRSSYGRSPHTWEIGALKRFVSSTAA